MSDAEHGPSAACKQALAIAAGVIDRWPHSIPPLSTAEILTSSPQVETYLSPYLGPYLGL
jgi:hypothetical protein